MMGRVGRLACLGAVAWAAACGGVGLPAGGAGGIGTNADEVALGRRLFFDPRLSGDQSRSCATCHQPSRGFADGKRRSRGVSGRPLRRHTPHLFNLAENTSFFWDGRVTSLEEQARVVLEDPEEMAQGLDDLVEELGGVTYYSEAFPAVYPRKGLRAESVLRAIAAYVASIRAEGGAYQKHLAGDTTALSPSALRGKDLFFGRAMCATCHSGPDFSDDRFHSTGVPGNDAGRAALDRVGDFRDRPYPFFQTHKAFKTPSLWNVAVTAPYFHDGSEPTLRDVLEFYNQGGKEHLEGATSPEIRPLGLGQNDLDDLEQFLRALTTEVDTSSVAPPGKTERYSPERRGG